MKRKEISDQTFGGILGWLYIIPTFVFFSKKFENIDADISVWESVAIFSIIWVAISLFDFYVNLTLFLSKGVLKENHAFEPLRTLASNIKHILCLFVVPYFQGLLVSALLWVLIGDRIFKALGFSWRQFSIKNALVFGAFLLLIVKLFSHLNRKLLSSKFPAFNKIDLDHEGHEEDEEDEKYDEVKRDILGKHVSNLFMVFFISTIFFGAIVVLGDEIISFYSYWLILYALLCLYNVFYLKKKLKKVPLLYCFLGALPFGFVLPAFLPQKR